MQFDENIIKKMEQIYGRLKACESDLCLEEVLMDKNLTSRLEKERGELCAIIEKYEAYQKLQKQYEKMTSEEISFFEKEYGSKEVVLNKAKTEFVTALRSFEGKTENIIVEISYKENSAEKLATDIMAGYKNFCKNNNFECKVEKAKKGYQLYISGENCFGIFKQENGIHSSWAGDVCVLSLPEIKKVEASFDEKDIKIDVYRSNGAGGQNVNKVSTAIRIRHLPTNVVVTCQDERSQFQNKERALKNLKEKVTAILDKNYLDALAEQRKKYKITEIVKIYDNKTGIITRTETKEKFDYEQFVEGKTGLKII